MDKQTDPVAKISLERAEISLTGMKISPYKHSQAGWSAKPLTGCIAKWASLTSI
jgi:hypothetical protein